MTDIVQQLLADDEKVEMLRLADDLAGGEVRELDTQQMCVIIRALRAAAGWRNRR
jgi:hypothetical protein